MTRADSSSVSYENGMSMMALEGIRVLDLSRLLPGPFCTLMMADLGAEVIKVEEPGKGDYSRHYRMNIEGLGINFLALNRGKKSITLNLKHPKGVEILKELAKEADVLLESFRPGVMDRLGVGYSVLSGINPRLIYCSLTGYGQTGPYRDYPGHDLNYMGYAGAASLTGRRDEELCIPGLQIADIGGGAMMAGFAILTAIIAREKTGKGQYIDVAMMDGVAFWMGIHFANALNGGETPKAGEMRLNGGQINYNIYQTKDGKYVTLGALEDKFWQNFCKLVNRPDLADKANAQGAERDELEKELRAFFKTRTQGEWLGLLAHEDVCFGPVNSVLEAYNDPQLKDREMFVEIPLPHSPKRMIQVAHPIKYSDTPAQCDSPPPLLGEHNREIYSALGYNVEELVQKGVI